MTPVWVLVGEQGPAGSSRDRALGWARRYARAQGLPEPGGWETLPGGKPLLAGGPHLSVSHSGELWACALHTRPVGLDIERRAAGRDTGAIVRRIFTREEQAFWAQNPEAFYDLWCAKEAGVKYRGGSIARDFRRISVVRRGRPAARMGPARLHRLSLDPGYCACLWAETRRVEVYWEAAAPL